MRRLAALVVVGLLAAACGSDGGSDGSDGSASSGGECPTSKPAEVARSFDGPGQCLEDGVDYGAVVTTSEGQLTIDLAEADAPITVNNFVFLARQGWFDGDDFHRVVPGFVFQGGDPFGEPQGTGGPGYVIDDELPTAVSDYTPGTVAMANSGPSSGGSQWFVCVDCSFLPSADYSIFGHVTAGEDVMAKIDALGEGDGPPSKPVTIESVEITEA